MYSEFEPVRYHGGAPVTMRDLEPPESVAEMSEAAGVSKRKAAALAGAGFESPKDLEKATPEELKAVPGIGPKDAERLAGKSDARDGGK
jgi:predicted flap endonuclease-1-like 5' DNA nuclease